jgi:hypothetical protein
MSQVSKLPAAPPEEPRAATTTPAGGRREAAIRADVLNTLGRPARLFRVAVLPLWGDHFRVNVLTGEDASAVVCADDDRHAVDDPPRVPLAGPHPPLPVPAAPRPPDG